jgi:DGQHR domain-containing protein
MHQPLEMMLKNVEPAEDLSQLARRKSQLNDYKSVRTPLVEEELKGGWQIAKQNKKTTRLERKKSLDRQIEDRVWTLMYKMGFLHLSRQRGAHLLLNEHETEGPENQIDVVAIDDEVALAIECKSSTTPRRYSDFSSDIAKHVAMRERFTRAVKQQIPGPKRPPVFVFWTHGLVLSDNDKSRAADEKVIVLDETDLTYYEQLVSEIRSAARFQFLADVLQGRLIPGLEITVPAVRMKMGGSIAYAFAISPDYLLKIAFVSHRARGKASDVHTYQRLLKRNRLVSIREYISEGGIFPTNIVVNISQSRHLEFHRGRQEDGSEQDSRVGWLTVRAGYRIAWIIDGQHRLFAYANHPLARKSIVSVIAFVGLEPSEQARLFVDINAKQKKVKPSLLQELYAELHWDSEEPEQRVRAILSKAVQALSESVGSPLRGRIYLADEKKSAQRCISMDAIFKAMQKGTLFIARSKKGEVQEFGPLWNTNNDATLKRTVALFTAYLNAIREKAPELWDKGQDEGGGLTMNDGITACINVLRSVLAHLQQHDRIQLATLSDKELAEVVVPWGGLVGSYFAALRPEDVKLFRALRGVQGQTTGTRKIQQFLHSQKPRFDFTELQEFIARTKLETTTAAFVELNSIEQILQREVLGELKAEYSQSDDSWWFSGVPSQVRVKVDERINLADGKKGGRAENFDLIQYRAIILANWRLFEATMGRDAGKNSKDARTKWLVDVNELRQKVMHASKNMGLPISQDELAYLSEVREWLKTSVRGQTANGVEAA